MSLTAEDLRGRKCDLFATKNSVDEALEYAQSLVTDKASMTIGILIYTNTVLEALAKEAEVKDVTEEKSSGISGTK